MNPHNKKSSITIIYSVVGRTYMKSVSTCMEINKKFAAVNIIWGIFLMEEVSYWRKTYYEHCYNTYYYQTEKRQV